MALMTSFLSLLEPLPEPNAPAPALPQEQGRETDFSTKADSLTVQARRALAEAEDVLAEARAEAATMREDAETQAEALREAAWQEGFFAGNRAARTQVEAELRSQYAAEREDFRAGVEAITTDIVATRQALWQSQEAEMVAFVLDIAKQVIKSEVSQNPEVIGSVLRNALRRVTDKEHVRIRVSLSDAAPVRAMRDDLLCLLDGIKNLEIVDDRRIGDGGCVIETNGGTIDAKIETQLNEVERALSDAVAE